MSSGGDDEGFAGDAVGDGLAVGTKSDQEQFRPGSWVSASSASAFIASSSSS
jgi:hypothetical protein